MASTNFKNNFSYRVNEEIKVPELRVVDANGKQIGILKTEVALAKAKKENLDLIEVAPLVKPPVAKMVNLGKFLYKEEKKLKKAKKSKVSELKEIRFSPFIAENDYLTRLGRVREFLSDRNKVKLTIVFKGRQMGSKNFGYDLLNKILTSLGDSVQRDTEPKFLGRNLVMVVSPLNQKRELSVKVQTINNAKSKNEKNNNKEDKSH